jgi:phosphoglucosamine mutase
MRYFNKPLSELSSMMKIFPQILINVPVKIKPDIFSVPRIAGVIRDTGMSIGDDGRILVRYSGTEPLCRVMVEGKDKGMIEKSARMIADAIKMELNP